MKRTPSVLLVGAVLLAVVVATWAGCAASTKGTYVRATVGGRPISFTEPLATLSPIDGFLAVQGFHYIGQEREELLSVNIPKPRTGGRWPLRASGDGAWAAHFVREITTDHIEAYHTDENHVGTVVITRFDQTLKVVEGTFEFDAILSNRRGPRQGPDTVHVRKGAFRARYSIDRPSSSE